MDHIPELPRPLSIMTLFSSNCFRVLNLKTPQSPIPGESWFAHFVPANAKEDRTLRSAAIFRPCQDGSMPGEGGEGGGGGVSKTCFWMRTHSEDSAKSTMWAAWVWGEIARPSAPILDLNEDGLPLCSAEARMKQRIERRPLE